ncbi:hypothetical protein [Achromobacter arsenitoxydans]|uniref:Uncharacterized protein n=1 Tax=Achromobacter arsenitoxydans SY8 TaxID=477184 RepID=H0F9J1_9BURK|nr:hypothetical protein [Achromobacter arsenitoxydans]EHK65256.1 hypothetical protein KYC_17217 [Achromobacter arsenitoxydans SY8]
MSFHTTIARLREATASHVRGEAPETCRVQREDLHIALHVIDRLDSDLRQAGALVHGAVHATRPPVVGEAQAVAWETNGISPTKDPALVETWRGLGWDVRPLYATPLASEAVRDAALEEAAHACEYRAGMRGPGAYTALTAVAESIRALKSRAALSAQPGAQKTGGSDA